MSTRPAALLGDDAFRRALEQLSLRTSRAVRPGLNGDHRGASRSNSAEFADHRPYSPGDDFRRIDWSLYGRVDGLFIRLNEAREDIGVHVLVDVSRSMDFGEPNKLRYAKRLAAAFSYLALARLDSVAVAPLSDTLGDRIGPVRGKDRVLRLLEALDSYVSQGQTDLNTVLRRYADQFRPGGLVIVLSDLLAPNGFTEGLERLRAARLDVLVTQVLAPVELNPSAEGDLDLLDRETGETIEVTMTDMVVAAYRERLQAWLDEVATTCRRLGVRYHLVSTATPIEEAVLIDMRARAIVH